MTLIARTRAVASDTLTPIVAYDALASGRGCLLESVDPGGRLSRYSFVGFDYLAEREFRAGPDLYDEIRAFIASYQVTGEAAPLGGALVAFAYDAARPVARLAPRYATAPPHMPDAYVAIPATWLIFDHYLHTLTVWHVAGSASIADTEIGRLIRDLLDHRTGLPDNVRGAGPVRASQTREQYLTHASAVKKHIYDGDVYQLQLGVRFSCALDGTPFDLYRALRRRNPSPYMFYVEGPFGELLGASPEFLVRLEGRRARIRPLAGTRSRGGDVAEDTAVEAELLSNEKERAEHIMLVDLGRNDLGDVCEYGSVEVTELLQIERYSHVMHIVSDVTGTLRSDRDALDLFRAGFPAGTVTGTPKVRAMQIIDQLEPVQRGFYAGSLGRWSFNGDFDSCITLRSMHVQDGRVHWQASAGIVADSDIEAEYDEVLHKTRIAREVLGVTL